MRGHVLRQIPLKRVGEPSDIAGLRAVSGAGCQLCDGPDHRRGRRPQRRLVSTAALGSRVRTTDRPPAAGDGPPDRNPPTARAIVSPVTGWRSPAQAPRADPARNRISGCPRAARGSRDPAITASTVQQQIQVQRPRRKADPGPRTRPASTCRRSSSAMMAAGDSAVRKRSTRFRKSSPVKPTAGLRYTPEICRFAKPLPEFRDMPGADSPRVPHCCRH